MVTANKTGATPGQILTASAQEGILVACGEGVLKLTELQKPGGKRLPAAEFLQGFPLIPDMQFNRT
jgi:methionyl-tRNA formyltransferase